LNYSTFFSWIALSLTVAATGSPVTAIFKGVDGGFKGVDGGFKGVDGGFKGVDGSFKGGEGSFKGGEGSFKGGEGSFKGGDPAVHQHMRARFERQRPALGLDFSAGQCAFDIPGPRVVALDQIRVVAIHDANKIGEFGSRLGMASRPERRGFSLYFADKLRQDAWDRVFKNQQFDSGWCLDHDCRSYIALSVRPKRS
jgi:hypothetical protein